MVVSPNIHLKTGCLGYQVPVLLVKNHVLPSVLGTQYEPDVV